AGPENAVDIDVALLERLARYSWPGNVRQLRNVVRTMLALRSGDRLTLADFNDSWLTGGTRAEEPTVQSGKPAEADVENVLGSAECDAQIGRASCRERVGDAGVAGCVKK